jgi:hypothetical protein
MKRLSWITVGLLTVEFFYLLMFVAVCISPADVCCGTTLPQRSFYSIELTFSQSLFGMNINLLESNPAWWLYAIFAAGTAGTTLSVWVIFKRNPDVWFGFLNNLLRSWLTFNAFS